MASKSKSSKREVVLAIALKSNDVGVIEVSDYDCFLRVLREHGIRVVEGESVAETETLPDEVLERAWRDLKEKCGAKR